MKKIISLVVLFLVLASAAYVLVAYYPYVFAKSVQGVIVKVERVNTPEAVITNNGSNNTVPTAQLFSFAVAIKDNKGEIHTASTEDRQWAVAQAGQCVEAKFFPYPPWQLDKASTFHGARLIRLYECPK